MKKTLFFLFLFLTMTLQSQGIFKLKSNTNQLDVSVNGVNYKIDSVGVNIPTNYPKFDSLIFKTESGNSNKLIWCNFNHDKTYIISGACCGNYDIIKEDKLKNDNKKTQDLIRDKPFISIRTKEKTNSKIYAWHSDPSCNTEHKIIQKEAWELGIPPKCVYWNNITSIVFFKESDKNENQQDKETAEFLGFKNIKLLSTFTFRIFDDKKYVITFDEQNEKVKIEYEK